MGFILFIHLVGFIGGLSAGGALPLRLFGRVLAYSLLTIVLLFGGAFLAAYIFGGSRWLALGAWSLISASVMGFAGFAIVQGIRWLSEVVGARTDDHN